MFLCGYYSLGIPKKSAIVCHWPSLSCKVEPSTAAVYFLIVLPIVYAIYQDVSILPGQEVLIFSLIFKNGIFSPSN